MNEYAAAGRCEEASAQTAMGLGAPAMDDAFYQPGGSGPDGYRYLSTPLTADPGTRVPSTPGRRSSARGRTAWLRMRHPLIAGEDPSPLARVLTAADSGNGVSSVLPFARWRFVNPDLTVYLHRMPVGEWICLDAATAVDPAGVGLASSIISDTDGLVGRGQQSLYVRAR